VFCPSPPYPRFRVVSAGRAAIRGGQLDSASPRAPRRPSCSSPVGDAERSGSPAGDAGKLAPEQGPTRAPCGMPDGQPGTGRGPRRRGGLPGSGSSRGLLWERDHPGRFTQPEMLSDGLGDGVGEMVAGDPKGSQPSRLRARVRGTTSPCSLPSRSAARSWPIRSAASLSGSTLKCPYLRVLAGDLCPTIFPTLASVSTLSDSNAFLFRHSCV